jgi:uncharacterized protein (DUF1015 family)
MRINPFRAMLPKKLFLAEIIAPPYDVVTRSEVKQAVTNNPRHFLKVTRPEAMLDDSIPFDDSRVYEAARANWQEMLGQGLFYADSASHYYVYAMDDGRSKQFGLVALISALDYKNGVVRRHELTRPDKENDRVKHIQAVNGQLSPVLLAVKDQGDLAQTLQQCAQGEPDLSASLNGVQHELWIVDSSEQQAKIDALFDQKDCLYVADGHHRTAAALRAYETSGHDPYCLAVIFPSQHMTIMGYHRVVKDLNDLSQAEFLDALTADYEVLPLAHLTLPPQYGVCHMLLGEQAYALTRKIVSANDPIQSLDVEALSTCVLKPLLGIEDIRIDPRIGFVGGINALADIQQQVLSGEAAVGFVMFPTQMDELLAVADANLLMPPKSTWFEPKLADGLVLYSFTP